METLTLQPGFGGRFRYAFQVPQETVAHVGEFGLDLSRCAQWALQVTGVEGDAISVQVQQSFNGTHWANLGSAITLNAAGAVRLFDITDGPHGFIRFVFTNTEDSSWSASSSSDEAPSQPDDEITLTVVGYPMQNSW